MIEELKTIIRKYHQTRNSDQLIQAAQQITLRAKEKPHPTTDKLDILTTLYQCISHCTQQTPILGSNDLKAIQHLAQSIIKQKPLQQHTIKTLTHIIAPSDLTQSNQFHPRFELHQALFSNLLTQLTHELIKLTLLPESKSWAQQYLNRLLDLAKPKLVFSILLSTLSSLARSKLTGSKQAQHEISHLLSLRLLHPSGIRGLLQSVITDDHQDDQDQQQQEDDDEEQQREGETTSITLKQFESLYHIISHPSSNVSTSTYWQTILQNLINIIIPQFSIKRKKEVYETFKNQRIIQTPDQIRTAACYIISQITQRQPIVYKTHLSPLLHAAFRPSQSLTKENEHFSAQSSSPEKEPQSSLQEEIIVSQSSPLEKEIQISLPQREKMLSLSNEEEEDQEIVSSTQIEHTLELLNQLILNSEPSHLFIDRLIVPILPQLISLIFFLQRIRAEPQIKQAADELVQIWIKLHPSETVSSWLVRAIREIEAGRELNRPDTSSSQSGPSSRSNQWARDPNGEPCIKYLRAASADSLDFTLDPDMLITWFKGLQTRQFLGHLLSTWLDEVIFLRDRPEFIEAKMTLFRIQCSLKTLDAFEIPQIISDPRHFFPFILNALRLHVTPKIIPPPKKPQKKKKSRQDLRAGSLTLESLKFLNLDCSSDDGQEHQHGLGNDADDDDDLDLDHGILVAGLSLLVALIEGHDDMDEENTPGLREISALIDELLLNQNPSGGRMISEEVYDLGIKSRLLLSVRKALSEVDRRQHDGSRSAREVDQVVQREKEALEGRYRSGLALLKDDCLPLRSQGISELKTVLLTSCRSPHTQKMVEGWAPQVIELLLGSVEEADSFVYLSAIKALSALAERFHQLVGPALAHAFARPLLQPTRDETDPAALRDFDRSVRVGEAMLQVIQRAGTALPLYINRLQPSLLLVLHSPLPTAAPLKPSALAILAACVEAAPAALAPSLSGLIQGCLDILRSTGPMSETIKDDCDACDAKPEEDSDEKSVEMNAQPEPVPIVSSVYAVHHHSTLTRAALLFIQTLLTQTLSLCRSASSSITDHTILKTIRMAIADDLVDIQPVLAYLRLSGAHLGTSPKSDAAPDKTSRANDHHLSTPAPHSSPIVAASLIDNALESLTVLRTVLGC
ncbi:hypothetical protein PCASD_04646 [Puccinia coronata f. sp. avenae]|uniref:RNA polymerase II assembly factor Rtp1 C-terminal domain-containing protein n=1 Tax=Puccinia coronata f. sp. avenae TaxID=200324 RepID=A0A2N5TBC2_9BASI|nr:hypothetical protein PCASD_14681 [Puccinia coronata f. sp. avenae]PLW42471.1 hypothetical protein PCASD_04646 [Puccinia coronata f. sp. avenae]